MSFACVLPNMCELLKQKSVRKHWTALDSNNKGKNIPTHPVSAQSKHEKLERPGLSALLPALGAAFARVESVVAPTSLREVSVPAKSQDHLVLGGSKLNHG